MRHYSYVRNLCNGFRSRSPTKLNTSKPQYSSSSSSTPSSLSGLHDNSALSSLKLEPRSDSGDSSDVVFKEISSIFYGGQSVKRPDSKEIDGANEFEKNISCLLNIPQRNVLLQRRERSRERKRKFEFKFAQENRFDGLIEIGAKKLGAEAILELFGKVGLKPGVKGYNALVEICIDKARGADDKVIAIEEMGKVFHLFKSMREQGLGLEEQTYRPLLLYIIDMCMVEEFQFFCHFIKNENPSSITRLGYYEMMLWLRVNNEEKIQGLCNYIAENDGEDTSDLRESYLLALCESERKEKILEVLEIIDIKKLSSAESVAKIFQALGRLLLEPVAEWFLLDFKTSNHDADNITNFIASYAVSIPNLLVEDVIKKFKDLHQELEVSPSSLSYEKLILHSCALCKVHVALDIVDEMCGAGLSLSTEVLHSILQICDETSEYNLVHRIFSTIRHYNLEPNDKTFRCMIDLFLKTKVLEGSYKTLDDLKEMNSKPTTGMYNVTMPECFQEYYEDNRATEQFMATIEVYAACGQLEKAKQVISNQLIPVQSLNQIKSVLVSVLASHGQLSEALLIYKEIKQAGHSLEPKDVMSLIEHTCSNGELDRLLLLLEELNDTAYWNDACCRIILYCIWNKCLSSAIDLCKLLKDKLQNDELVMEVLFDKVFSLIEESESNHLHTCLELLSEIKDKLGLLPSHKCYDSLLGARAKANNSHNAE